MFFFIQQSENIYGIGKEIMIESKNTQCRIQELKQSLPTRQEFEKIYIVCV